MKKLIAHFLEDLVIYDYILFAAIVLVFLLLIILSIALYKRLTLSLFVILMALALLTAGTYFGHKELHNYLYANTVTLNPVKELEYSDAIILTGSITNNSQRVFKRCSIRAKAFKVEDSFLFDTINEIKPFYKTRVKVEGPIKIQQSRKFKIIMEPFKVKGDYNVSMSVSCK